MIGYGDMSRRQAAEIEALRDRVMARQMFMNSPGAVIRVPRQQLADDPLYEAVLRSHRGHIKIPHHRIFTQGDHEKILAMLEATKPKRAAHTRTDDSLVAWVAAPIWAYVWCLTFGRFGKPLWREA